MPKKMKPCVSGTVPFQRPASVFESSEFGALLAEYLAQDKVTVGLRKRVKEIRDHKLVTQVVDSLRAEYGQEVARQLIYERISRLATHFIA